MSRRKTAVGIAVLFALALSAFSAAGASAEVTGTKAFTCVASPSGTLKGEHCLTSGTGEPFKHVGFKTKTTVTATNANTAANGAGETTKASRPSKLHGTISGLETELECLTLHGEGFLENKAAGEENFVHVTGSLKYSECAVLKPAGKSCIVGNGKTVTTSALTGTTEKQGDAALIKPAEGTEFASIKIESCTVAGLNNTFPVSGTLIGEISGATVSSTRAGSTAANTLKFGGQKAGLDGALTLKGHEKNEEVTKPITVTTPPYTE